MESLVLERSVMKTWKLQWCSINCAISSSYILSQLFHYQGYTELLSLYSPDKILCSQCGKDEHAEYLGVQMIRTEDKALFGHTEYAN